MAEDNARALAAALQSAKADLAQASCLLTCFRAPAPAAAAIDNVPVMGPQALGEPVQAQRTAAAAAVHPGRACAAADGTAAPIAAGTPLPFEFQAPSPLSGLEQPYITSLTAAMQSNAEAMAKEAANIRASFDSQAKAARVSVESLVSTIKAGQVVPANSPAAAAPGGGAPR